MTVRLCVLVLGLVSCLDGEAEKDLVADTSESQTTTSVDGPSCSGCQLVFEELAECDHPPFLEVEGQPCGSGYCIYNRLDTYSCTLHPNATGPSECNAGLVGVDALTQQLRVSASCTGSDIILWNDYRTLAGGCPGDACKPFLWSTACEMSSLDDCPESATSAYPLVHRGDRYVCDICG